MIKCSLCLPSFPQFSIGEYTKHLRLFHSGTPGFKITCGINGCQKAYSNIGTFKNHLYGVHCDYDGICSTSVTMGSESLNQEHDLTEAVESVVAVVPSDNDASGNVPESEHQVRDVVISDSAQSSFSPPDMQKSSALLLLGLKEKHKLTQVTVQSIIDSVTTLTQQRLSTLKSQVWI